MTRRFSVSFLSLLIAIGFVMLIAGGCFLTRDTKPPYESQVLYEDDFSTDDCLKNEHWIGVWNGLSIENGKLTMRNAGARFLMLYKQDLSGSIAIEADITVEDIVDTRDGFGFAIYRTNANDNMVESGYFVLFHTFNPAEAGDKWQVDIYKPDGKQGIKLMEDTVFPTDVTYAVGGTLSATKIRIELLVEDAFSTLTVYMGENRVCQIEDMDEAVSRYSKGFVGLYKESDSTATWDNFKILQL